MLAQKYDQAGDCQRGKQKIGAEILGTVHVRHEIVPWFDERSNAALRPEKRGALSDGAGRTLRDFLLRAYGFASEPAWADMGPGASVAECSPWRGGGRVKGRTSQGIFSDAVTGPRDLGLRIRNCSVQGSALIRSPQGRSARAC